MTDENPNISPTAEAPKQNSGWSFMEFIKFAVIAAIIVLPIRFFIAEPFLVRGESMNPTFKNNDYLIVEKIGYRFEKPLRGEIVIFSSPSEQGRDLIKRIIGLPGETVEIDGTKVTIVQTDGTRLTLEEPYIDYNSISPKTGTVLKDGEYFVMGDNRPNSYDSRGWGVLPFKNIIGRPLIRFFHFDKIGIWPGAHTFEN